MQRPSSWCRWRTSCISCYAEGSSILVSNLIVGDPGLRIFMKNCRWLDSTPGMVTHSFFILFYYFTFSPRPQVNEIFEELNIGYMLDLSCCFLATSHQLLDFQTAWFFTHCNSWRPWECLPAIRIVAASELNIGYHQMFIYQFLINRFNPKFYPVNVYLSIIIDSIQSYIPSIIPIGPFPGLKFTTWSLWTFCTTNLGYWTDCQINLWPIKLYN